MERREALAEQKGGFLGRENDIPMTDHVETSNRQM